MRWLVALWLLCAWAIPARADQVRHAVVVGANQGGGTLEPLRYAETDAAQVGALLVELGGFDEELVTVLYAPDDQALRLALAEHAAVAQQYDDDLFLLYYSGHADAQGLRLGSGRYFFEALQHDFRAIDASVRVGILDACRSGAITRLKGASVGDVLIPEETTAEGEAWLTASAADELAQESEVLRGGFFTHFLLSGLRGAADLDDGVVDLEELKQYTTDRVIARTSGTAGGTQHPHFSYKLDGWGTVGLTAIDRADARLRLPPSVEGYLSVLRLPDRVQIAELAKHPGQSMTIGLPAGKYLIRRSHDGKLYEVIIGLNSGAELDAPSNWGTARVESGFARGDAAATDRYLDLSQAYEQKLNLSGSPAIAAGASAVIPGAGQLYNRQFVKGAAYFVATASLVGTIFAPQDVLDPRIGPMIGLAIWGASVADAAYNVHRYEKERPFGGLTLSGGIGVGGQTWPTHAGLSADLMIGNGFSFGLDRIGYTPYEGGWDLAAGSRFMMAFHEGRRWRPGAFVSVGYRHGQVPGETVRLSRIVFGAGANVRYYPVPRYFLEVEARWEQNGEENALISGAAAGVHFGR